MVQRVVRLGPPRGLPVPGLALAMLMGTPLHLQGTGRALMCLLLLLLLLLLRPSLVVVVLVVLMETEVRRQRSARPQGARRAPLYHLSWCPLLGMVNQRTQPPPQVVRPTHSPPSLVRGCWHMGASAFAVVEQGHQTVVALCVCVCVCVCLLLQPPTPQRWPRSSRNWPSHRKH